MKPEIVSLVEQLVLANAIKYDGKANPGAITGGVLGTFPDAKQDMKSLMALINDTVKKINSLSLDKQKELLLKLNPNALDKKEHKHDLFGFLNIPEGFKVKSAFPPGPEKYPHIGHAKALIINYMLAKEHGGNFCLRFEDTNPELVKQEFYKVMLDDFAWLGVSWDELVYASDYMDLYYKHCEDLLERGEAYVCSCNVETIRKGRETGEPCKCRSNDSKVNLSLWEKMLKDAVPGSMVVRLKIDLKHKNSTMRDPSIFRIIEAEHARHAFKYRVWPNYDFQNSIMDGYFKVTHRIRSKEFEMRNELQRYIQKLLGYNETFIYEFARFNITGVEASGRIIREKINNKELLGWDDPSLTTISALRRRGFEPEAIREFVVKTGITKNESTMTWDDLIMYNKRLLDKKCDHLFFVAEPLKVKVNNAPSKKIELRLNVNKEEKRIFETNDSFYISHNDFKDLKKGHMYRFVELFNVIFNGEDFDYAGEDLKKYKEQGKGMIHYLPCSQKSFKATILFPDKKVVNGLVEESVKNYKEGIQMQFERFGFVKLDEISEDTYNFRFTH